MQQCLPLPSMTVKIAGFTIFSYLCHMPYNRFPAFNLSIIIYLLTEPAGKKFHPDFKPQLTPAEMLELGVFGGRYMTDCRNEFPKAWFKGAKLYKGNSPIGDKELNFFKTHASQPLSVWKKKE